MTTRIEHVRRALADAASYSGLPVSAYETDTIVTPAGQVTRRAMDPRTVFTAATNVYAFSVIVYANRVDEIAAQRYLDALADVSGDVSLKAAIENEDRWPADLVHYAQVTRIGEIATYEVAGVAYLGFAVDVEVVF